LWACRRGIAIKILESKLLISSRLRASKRWKAIVFPSFVSAASVGGIILCLLTDYACYLHFNRAMTPYDHADVYFLTSFTGFGSTTLVVVNYDGWNKPKRIRQRDYFWRRRIKSSRPGSRPSDKRSADYRKRSTSADESFRSRLVQLRSDKRQRIR